MIGTLRQFVEAFVKKTFDCLHAERPGAVGFCALSASSRFLFRRTVVIATLLSLALAGGAVALAQAAGGGRPAIGSASPHELERNARLVVKGRGFVPGTKHNVIVFRGGPGGSDDVRVHETVAHGTQKIVLRAPFARFKGSGGGAVSGPLQVVNRNGRSKPTRFSVFFDDDGDGWPNEKELREGTNPRRADTDGDGVPDAEDADPLNTPSSGGGGPPPPPPPDEEPTSFDCNSRGPALAGTGLASSLEGLANVIDEGRPKVGHGAFAGAGFKAICLLRKKRDEPDITYQLVGTSGSPLAGIIQDNQRVAKGTDYLYRIDVVTDAGHVPGSNTLAVRGAGKVPNVEGWAQVEQNCTQCGSSSAQSGSLRSTIDSDGPSGPGDYVGEVAVYQTPVALTWREGEATIVETRALVPIDPSTLDTHVAAQLNLSVDHPAGIRDDEEGTVADLRGSEAPWISVELRSDADGDVIVVARDSASVGVDHVIASSGDLTAEGLQNVYLTVEMSAPGRYEVRYKPNTAEPDVDQVLDLDPGLGTDRALPGSMPEAWLSLVNETSRAELAAHDVRFDEVHAVYQTDYRDVPQESFGGISTNVQLPQGFDAVEVASDLDGPTTVDFAANGDMYLSLRDGKVVRLDSEAAEGAGNAGSFEEVLDIEELVNSGPNDQGLTGFTLDPGFESNGFFYVYYTVQKADTFGDRTVSRVERFKLHADGTAHLDDPARKILVGADAPAPGTGDTCPPGPSSDCLPSDAFTHSAGDVKFGSDGMLWISTPDGASPEGPGKGGTDPLALRSIDPDSLAGKVLRVDPATGDGVPGNPEYASQVDKSTPKARTWAMGFRNPLRIAERPNSPGSWYATDVGWADWEELDLIPGTASAGVVPNYGWPCYEGTPESSYKALYPSECGFASPRVPLHEYDSTGVDHAIIGGAFYTGSAYPLPWKPAAGQAAFYYGDYPSGDIVRVLTGAADEKLDVSAFGSGFTSPVMTAMGPVDRAVPAGDQTLYIVDLGPRDEVGGKVWRVIYEGP
jgi:glucose/arabinose dehydrogenase